jgi:hypothetical protein
MLWAQRVIARKNGPPHLLLELGANATPDEAQEAFHKIARTAHPDLHRQGLTPEDLEIVTSAYAAVAGAYMQVRSQTMATQRLKPLKPDEVSGLGNAAPVPPHRPTPIPAGSGRTPPAGVPTAPSPPPGPPTTVSPQAAAAAMSPKAIVDYRKAEAALKRGDFKSAMLQVKLAIAADPTSAFLRSALAEIDAELRRNT